MTHRILLATGAAIGVLAAGCSNAPVDTSQAGLIASAIAEQAGTTLPPVNPNCPHSQAPFIGYCTVFDVDSPGWAWLPNNQLPLPHAIGQDACEMPSDLPYTETKPAGIRRGSRLVRVSRTDNGDIAWQFEGDKNIYLAIADDEDTNTPTDRFRGMPYSFRPCPPWAK